MGNYHHSFPSFYSSLNIFFKVAVRSLLNSTSGPSQRQCLFPCFFLWLGNTFLFLCKSHNILLAGHFRQYSNSGCWLLISLPISGFYCYSLICLVIWLDYFSEIYFGWCFFHFGDISICISNISSKVSILSHSVQACCIWQKVFTVRKISCMVTFIYASP